MASVIFLMLPLSVLFVFGLMALAFADVAFREARVASFGGNGSARQNPTPLAEISSSLGRLSGGVSSTLHLASIKCESFVPCVTDVEASAIAQDLRQRHDGSPSPAGQGEGVRERSPELLF